MKKYSFIIFIFIVSAYTAIGQSPKDKFYEAEDYFYYREYEKALPIYLALTEKYPQNANYKYRLGICFLYSTNEQYKSVKYLEEATKKVVEFYNDGFFGETNAPRDVYFYLGIAYHINNEVEKAKQSYLRFKQTLDPKDVTNIEYVDHQIQVCDNALKLMKTPVKFKATQIEKTFFNPQNTSRPLLSGDGNTFIYFGGIKDTGSVYCSRKTGNNWQKPMNITKMLASLNNIFPTGLSYDGNELYLTRLDVNESNIYYSKFENGKWTKAEKLNKNINTKYNETHASISKDGHTLYFTSSRKDGFGGLDIYKSQRGTDGDWGKPENLGSTINTIYNEETPFITQDDKTLYFSSEGQFCMGGFDIFYSTLSKDGKWSVPTNIGFPINTTNDNVFYNPILNAESGYYAMVNPNKASRTDIYKIEFGDFTANNDTIGREIQITQLKDTVKQYVQKQDTVKEIIQKTDTLKQYVQKKDTVEQIVQKQEIQKQEQPKQSIQIVDQQKVISIEKPKYINLKVTINLKDIGRAYEHMINVIIVDTLNHPNKIIPEEIEPGVFNCKIKPGNYLLTAECDSYMPLVEYFNISENYYSKTFEHTASMTPVKMSTGEFLAMKAIFFDYNSFQISDQAITELEKVAYFMMRHPSLYLEVIGYADAKGSTELNIKLSEQRSQSVIDYLVGRGIDEKRFVLKALGEEKNVAINTNPDGSDNPEGRKLNRRVEVKILKSDENVSIEEDLYVPEYLKISADQTFTIFLKKDSTDICKSWFINYPGIDTSQIKVFNFGTENIFVLGHFSNKGDALPVLNTVVEGGLTDARIINYQEINFLTVHTKPHEIQSADKKPVYTIQLMALLKPVNLSYFKGLSGIKVSVGNDKFNRYTYGEFYSYNEADQAWKNLRENGYPFCFLRKIEEIQNYKY